MKPIYQTKFRGSTAPENEQGNCVAACIASIFECELENAPDFTGEIIDGEWFFHLQTWLAERNLSLLLLPAKPIDIPFGYSMLAVKSKTLSEDGHMIVAKDGLPIHDPNPNSEEPYEIEGYWIFTVRDPSKMMEE